MKLGEKIAALRERDGQRVSQAELARRSGVVLRTLQHYEQGRRVPSFPAAVKLADALGVPLEELAACVRPKRGKK